VVICPGFKRIYLAAPINTYELGIAESAKIALWFAKLWLSFNIFEEKIGGNKRAQSTSKYIYESSAGLTRICERRWLSKNIDIPQLQPSLINN
jgi:hypothetical protein